MEDLTGKSWRNDRWLQQFPLNSATAIAYFAESIFYDSNCNNEIARRQFMDINRVASLPPGVEYVLTESQEPHLFVICKQKRSQANEPAPQAYYYILDGNIYQAPTLHQVLTARMERCKWSMRQAFVTMKQHLDPLSQSDEERAEKARKAKEAAVAEEVRPNPMTPEELEHVAKVDNIIMTAFRKV